jgi:hypothetical protein
MLGMGQHCRLAHVVYLAASLAAGSMAAFADDAARAPHITSPPRLDLRAPPLSHVLSSRQISALAAELTETPADDVTIKATRDTPACCGTFIAVPWAITHPRNAWRIFTPVVGACPGTWCTEHAN